MAKRKFKIWRGDAKGGEFKYQGKGVAVYARHQDRLDLLEQLAGPRPGMDL